MHESFAWIPSWLTVAPSFPSLALANRFWDLPGTDRFRELKLFPKPVEPNPVLARWLRTYPREDASPEVVEEGRSHLLPLIEKLCRYHGKQRFLAKLVGRPIKVEFLAALYPTATFIHITRALKPTVASLMQVEFYKGDRLARWPWGEVPKRFLDCYEASGRAEEVAAAISVKLNLIEMRRQLATLPPARWAEVGYSDFVRDPVQGIERIAAIASFEVNPRFIDRIRARRLYGGADEKWKRYFSDEQQRNLDAVERLD